MKKEAKVLCWALETYVVLSPYSPVWRKNHSFSHFSPDPWSLKLCCGYIRMKVLVASRDFSSAQGSFSYFCWKGKKNLCPELQKL